MRLTQVLLRKRKMRTKPQSFVRNWQWNTAWYLNQERRVLNMGMKEALEERRIPVYSQEEVVSPVHPPEPRAEVDIVETRLGPVPRDESHPLWQAAPAHTYSSSTKLPKGLEMEFAQAVTNSLAVEGVRGEQGEPVDFFTEERLATAIRSAYIGDAVQKKLPRNWKVPFIGYHPVETQMRPRNQYDWQQFSWGRSMPREYGVPIHRKLLNLARGLVEEVLRAGGASCGLVACQERVVERQFLTTPQGDLLRYDVEVPLTLLGRNPRPQAAPRGEVEATQEVGGVSVAPMATVAPLLPTNIYRPGDVHPLLSLQHSHPYINTVFHFNKSHIGDPFTDDRCWRPAGQRGHCLLTAYAAAVGQARLLYGGQAEGLLPKPVTINAVSTNGVWWEMGTLQLNSLDLSSKYKNLYFHHPESLRLMDFCGYREARPELEGLRVETFQLLRNLVLAK